MFTKLKVWICKTFYIVGLSWWRMWSLLYAKFWKWKNGCYGLPKELNAQQILEKFELLTWTPDGAKELWDVCAGPEWVQKAIMDIEAGEPQPEGGLDCDDFAIWAANTAMSDYFPHVVILTWLSEEDEIKGHAMCVLHYVDGTNCFISNWGLSEPFVFLAEGCEKVLQDVRAKELIGWAALDKRLSLVEHGTKEFPNRTLI